MCGSDTHILKGTLATSVVLQCVLEALKPGQDSCCVASLVTSSCTYPRIQHCALKLWVTDMSVSLPVPVFSPRTSARFLLAPCALRVCVLCVSDVTVGQQLNLPRYLSLDLFAGPPVVSSSALSSALVWLLSDKCVVWGSVCACHLSVSLSRIRHLTENLGTRSQHILYKKKTTHTHTLAHIPTHTRIQFYAELHLQSYSPLPPRTKCVYLYV